MSRQRDVRRGFTRFRTVLLAAAMIGLWPAVASAQTAGVAFTSYRAGNAHVFVVNADGGGLRALTTKSNAAFEGAPAYSPDATRIAYTCGNFELCVMGADGAAPARLTTNDWPRAFGYDTSPAWSPDGTAIAFVRTVAGDDTIWIVNSDGSGLRRLPVPAGVNNHPSFSPDGASIAFDHAEDQTSSSSDLQESSDGHIWVIGVDGSAPHSLTRRGVDTDPAWSPDGRSIAFTHSTDETSQVFVMNPDGSARRRVTARTTRAADPAWSPDSARIAYSAIGAGGSTLFRVAAGGGKPVRLTTGRGPDFDPAWQPAAAAAVGPSSAPAALATPSVATEDARVVAVLLRAWADSVPVFSSITAKHPAGLLRAARRMDAYARRISAAARPLRPASRRGRTIRRELLQNMTVVRGIASGTRSWSRSLRRHDRRAAAKQRNGVLFTAGFGFFLPLLATTGIAGVSRAT